MDEDRRGLDKVHADSTETANGMMQAVNQSWNEVKSALRAADLTRLLSDPASFRVSSDGLGHPAQAMRRCQATAAEAQEAVQRALIELREHKKRRLLIILGMAIAILILVAVVAFQVWHPSRSETAMPAPQSYSPKAVQPESAAPPSSAPEAQAPQTSSAAAPSDAVVQPERLIGSAADDAVLLYAAEQTDSVVFRLAMRKPWYSPIEVDVNQNQVVDRMVDVSYGVGGPLNSDPCNVYMYTEDSNTACGGFASMSTFNRQDDGNTVEIVRVIPKRELTTIGGSVWVKLKPYDVSRNRWEPPTPIITFVFQH